MIGLPFPNPSDPELQERQKYISKHHGEESSKIYYKNLCMRAVNQSIGRAIRYESVSRKINQLFSI